MSLSKAYQDIVEIKNSPEYQEYLLALIKNKDEAKRWHRIRKSLNPDSEDVTEQLQYFQADRRHRKACAEFAEVRVRYEQFRIKRSLKNISPKELLRMLGEKIPLTMDDLIQEQKQAAIAQSISNDEFETIKNAALPNSESNETTKERFLNDKKKNDPTLEDEDSLP